MTKTKHAQLTEVYQAKPQQKSIKMHSNVILTFNTDMNEFDDFQEVFNLNLWINPKEKSCFDFLNRELFPRIVEKCSALSRDPKDLMKISTASNWDLFSQTTELPSPCDLSHPCKWYFGYDRPDMDFWERDLMVRHGFGLNASFYELFTTQIQQGEK
jgi:hypothetical protein